jgi:hypothetical protein
MEPAPSTWVPSGPMSFLAPMLVSGTEFFLTAVTVPIALGHIGNASTKVADPCDQ